MTVWNDAHRWSRERLRLEEELAAVEEYTRVQVREGRLPDVGRLPLRRYAALMEWAGGLVLALHVAAWALLLSFVIFNLVLHISL